MVMDFRRRVCQMVRAQSMDAFSDELSQAFVRVLLWWPWSIHCSNKARSPDRKAETTFDDQPQIEALEPMQLRLDIPYWYHDA